MKKFICNLSSWLMLLLYSSRSSSSSTSSSNSVGYSTEALADEVKTMPGSDLLSFTFRHFSGYLNIPGYGKSPTKQMHYWFVESMKNPSLDPIGFWTNGGPGCSGLVGFFTEQGPFRPQRDMTLSLNPYAWNRVANMVFLETPTGVGFSFSTMDADYDSGDNSTAHDNYQIIQAFFQRFPQYRSNSMYIASESYGGHYLPTLAKVIVDENKNPTTSKPKLLFKGLAVGNPFTDDYSGTGAMIDTFWGHQLIAQPVYEAYRNACVLHRPLQQDDCNRHTIKSITHLGILNFYALDFPVCLTSAASRKETTNRVIRDRLSLAVTVNGEGMSLPQTSRPSRRSVQKQWLLRHLVTRLQAQLGDLGEGQDSSSSLPDWLQLSSSSLSSSSSSLSSSSTAAYEPCEDDYTAQYLNQPVVKAAVHVNQSLTWHECSDQIRYNYSDMDVSTVPLFKDLIDHADLDILVYSGDDDAVCATIGTQRWLWGLGYPVASKHRWQEHRYGGQVAGFLTKFTGVKLGLLTVHGAGHEVPTYRPAEAYDMWVRYLNGEFTSISS